MIMEHNCEDKTDEELVILVLQDPDYFLCLMKRYENKLLAYIIRISGLSKEDAEDVLQDGLIKIYQNINSFNTSLKFSSWAYRIIHNQVINNFHKLKARPSFVFSDIGQDKIDKLASEFDLENSTDKKIKNELIIQVINKLDSKYKEVLMLKFIEEKDYKEISDILKKPMGTIATLINRAKKQFKKEVEKQDIKF
jgi:RNA polymerase sigma-70 factor, ECF subfamily